MEEINNEINGKKLDVVIELLQNLLAVQLFRNGASRQEIAKQLHVAKATVVRMLHAVKKEK